MSRAAAGTLRTSEADEFTGASESSRHWSGALSFGTALDLLEHGLILLSRYGVVLFANEAASEIVARGTGLSVAAGQLRTDCRAETEELRRLVRRSASVRGDRVPDSMQVSRAAPLGSLTIAVSTLAGSAANGEGPAVAIHVFDPDRWARLRSKLLQESYGLTSAEATVAIAVAQGRGVRRVASELGASHSTVRTHLQRVFEKTGTCRQSMLAWLVARPVFASAANRCDIVEVASPAWPPAFGAAAARDHLKGARLKEANSPRGGVVEAWRA